MGISIGTVWECRGPNGNQSNGGGFDLTYGGVDQTLVNGLVTSRTNVVLNYVAAPSAPALTDAGAGGSTVGGTYQVKITYLGLYGIETVVTTESAASAASSLAISANHKIQVTSPAGSEGATHYRVYITTAGTSNYQTPSAAVAIGVDFTKTTEPSGGTVTPPAGNTMAYYTSAGTPYTTSDPGNCLCTTAGAGFTTGRYQVRFVTGTNAFAMLDKAAGTAASTGGTSRIGGAMALITDIEHFITSDFVAGNGVWAMGAGTVYSEGSFTASSGTRTNPTIIQGYGSIRGDLGRPIIRASGASVTLFTNNASTFGLIIKNLVIDGNNQNGTSGIVSTFGAWIENCKIMGTKRNGISGEGLTVYNCEITGCGSDGSVINPSGIFVNVGCLITGCYIHDNTTHGIWMHGDGTIERNIICNNTGAAIDNIHWDAGGGGSASVINNVILGAGRSGLYFETTATALSNIYNNIFMSNGASGTGYGIQSVDTLNYVFARNNGFYNNATGQTLNVPGMTGAIALTSDPFTNSAGGDFSLNLSTTAGNQCKNAGLIGAFPLGLTPSAGVDVGAWQTNEIPTVFSRRVERANLTDDNFMRNKRRRVAFIPITSGGGGTVAYASLGGVS